MLFNYCVIQLNLQKDGYEFLSFARTLNNKYGQKLVDSAKKSAKDAFKIAC